MLVRDEYTVSPLDLDLPLTVSPSMVSPTRRIIEAKLGPVLEDEDAIFRVAMTAHELLENAAKYASDGKARLELSVTPRDEGAIVRVVVTNNSTQEHIAELGACYAEMNAAKDAMAHYFSLMRMNAKAGRAVPPGAGPGPRRGGDGDRGRRRGGAGQDRGVRHRRQIAATGHEPRPTEPASRSGGGHQCRVMTPRFAQSRWRPDVRRWRALS